MHCCVMFRRFGLLIFRNVFRNVTVRTALAFVAVLLLLRTLKYGSEYFMRVDRFYLKVCQFTCSIFYMHTYVNSFISNCTTKFQIYVANDGQRLIVEDSRCKIALYSPDFMYKIICCPMFCRAKSGVM